MNTFSCGKIPRMRHSEQLPDMKLRSIHSTLPALRRLTLDTLFPPTELMGERAAAFAEWRPDPPGSYCTRCGATAGFGAVTETGCPHCRDQRLPWDSVYRLGVYRSPLDQWIVRLKFHHAWAWGSWFGRRLASILPDDPQAVVIPVPLHWRRRLLRGFDQTHLIARELANAKSVPLAPVLSRRRATAAQSHLQSRERRARNVRRAFRPASVDLGGQTAWLVDDVKTTGATAAQCARLLRRAGAEAVHLVVVAVADPAATDFRRR